MSAPFLNRSLIAPGLRKSLLLTILLFAVSFSLNSTLLPPQTRPIEVLAEWKSGNNGVANISLTFYKNHKFIFYMGILPGMDEPGGEIDEIRSRGVWRHRNGWTTLKFKKKDLKLDVLFDERSVRDGRIKLVGKHKVEVGGMPNAIKIWNVWCKQKAA